MTHTQKHSSSKDSKCMKEMGDPNSKRTATAKEITADGRERHVKKQLTGT